MSMRDTTTMNKEQDPNFKSRTAFVSVVIPVYNDSGRLQKTLASLRTQSYPNECYEVIVVDNGSTDESVEVASSFDEVNVLFEHHHLSSPYSARNRGIEQASGEVIALLDATCVPVEGWLREAVKCFEETGADLLGGDVQFSFQGQEPGPGELYDSLTNVQMKESVAKGEAKTANLFVRREVFEEIGLFTEGIRSGGDVEWTRYATDRGFDLAFCEEATVFKPARGLLSLIRKQWRVGKGKGEIRNHPWPRLQALKLLIIALLPPGFEWLRKKAEDRGHLNGKIDAVELWFVRYIVSITMKCAISYVYIFKK